MGLSAIIDKLAGLARGLGRLFSYLGQLARRLGG